MAYGRFEIPATDLNRILDRIRDGGTVKPFGGYSHVTTHAMTETWWRPDRLREPRVAEWSEPGFSVNLMFGKTDQIGMLTVYFVNFEM